jgi:hypothetical protein
VRCCAVARLVKRDEAGARRGGSEARQERGMSGDACVNRVQFYKGMILPRVSRVCAGLPDLIDHNACFGGFAGVFSRIKCLFCRITGKWLDTGVTNGDYGLISGCRPSSARQKPVMRRYFQKIPCYQVRDQFAHDCTHHQAFQVVGGFWGFHSDKLLPVIPTKRLVLFARHGAFERRRLAQLSQLRGNAAKYPLQIRGTGQKVFTTRPGLTASRWRRPR